MRLIKASYKIMTPINGEEILKQIELAARTCYRSEGKIEYEPYRDITGEVQEWMGDDIITKSAKVLIPKLISRGHFAMLEFGGMITVRFIVDRGVSHELVRHRLASFAQESTRYCNYEGKHMEFIIPCWLNIKEGVIEYPFYSYKYENPVIIDYLDTLHYCEETYNNLIGNHNWSPQQARSVLPNSLKTEINMSCNIREWREVFTQRCSNSAHPQMQEVMRPLLAEFQQKIPILFDDINY